MQAQSFYVSPTKYDYSGAAKQITAHCSTDYERVRAIYDWLCRNISYDTTYSIYTADGCWEQRRGVCQAYSELFYYMAQSLGIRADLVVGTAKSIHYRYDSHTWIYAEVDRQRHQGILLDPTWGAGNVNNGIFTRSENNDEWFDVSPEQMIYTHFPNDSRYQLLSSPISEQKFKTMPYVRPDFAEVVEIPQEQTLRVGQTYRFSFRKRNNHQLAVICNGDFCTDDRWMVRNGVYTIDYTPSVDKEFGVAWYDETANIYRYSIVYSLAPPTSYDLSQLEKKRPFSMPEIKRLKGPSVEQMKALGIDGHQLLKEVRSGNVSSLPEFYSNDYLEIVEMPLDRTLRVGESYLFCIKPKVQAEWAVVNGEHWMKEWTMEPSGVLRMTVVPKISGQLLLYACPTGSGDRYQGCIGYDVK